MPCAVGAPRGHLSAEVIEHSTPVSTALTTASVVTGAARQVLHDSKRIKVLSYAGILNHLLSKQEWLQEER